MLTIPAAGGITPAIAVPAENLGLRTLRSGAFLPSGYPDDLTGLDFAQDLSAPPVINDVPDQTVQENQAAGPINLVISDPDTPVGELASVVWVVIQPRAGAQREHRL